MELVYQIPRSSLIWVLSSVVLALAPQSLRLPIWISLIAGICILWRVLIFTGRLDYPGKSMRFVVVIFIILLSLTQLQSIDIDLNAASTLLALGFVFKLIEMRNKRDIYVVLCLCFIMALVAFIYSESVLITTYYTIVLMVTVATMISLNKSSRTGSAIRTFRLAVRITAQSLPLMIVLFMIFPRIAPLWGVPLQANSATVGVSDEMSPGDISSLGRSADLAFRVTFENSRPPLHENLYWRGLVLDQFDGTTWKRSRSSMLGAAVARTNANINNPDFASVTGAPLEYNIIIEPTQQPWMYGLHLSEPVTPGLFRGSKFELFADGMITNRSSYDMRTYRNYQTDLVLTDPMRRSSLALPETGNLRARELAESLRSGVVSDRDYAFTVLSLFQQQEFYYTLEPALLGANRIDEFLFDTREGFCEHYASSFTFMMRAAGVPARVVVGYQGAEYNSFEDYLMVYQYNAHAWTEVWLEGEGWIRFDPTAIVSPERIRVGVEAALQDDPRFMDESLRSIARFRNSNWVNMIRLRLDAIEYEWNRRVVSYDQDTQLSMFENLFGEYSARKLVITMMISTGIILMLVALTVIRVRPVKTESKIELLYLKCCKELSRIGLKREAGEGPLNFYHRVAAERPELAAEFLEITERYVNINYGPAPERVQGAGSSFSEFKKMLARFRARVSRLPSNSVLSS